MAFELAAKLGYDGVEVMVWTDPVSQDPYALQRLSQHYEVPILAIHAPCLIITQRVWTHRPVGEAAEGAVRRRAARRADGRRAPAVPLAARLRPQLPRGHRAAWPTRPTCASRSRTCSRCGCAAARCRPTSRAGTSRPTTSRTATTPWTCRTRPCRSPTRWPCSTRWATRLAHLHIADGTGLTKDEHLIPGRGDQPCAEVLERLAARGFDGHVIVEVNTRRALDRAEREADLAEALAFCRLHLVAAARPLSSA